MTEEQKKEIWKKDPKAIILEDGYMLFSDGRKIFAVGGVAEEE